MSLFVKAVAAALPVIVLLGGAVVRLAARGPYVDVPLDELPFVISADGLTEAQLRSALAEIGEIPDGAYVSIVPFEYTRADFEAGRELPFSHDKNELPPGFSIKPLDDPGNPYRDQYGDWDVWEYENYQWLCEEYNYDKLTDDELADFMNAQHDDPRLENHGNHLLAVKSDGYLVPAVEMAKSWAETGAFVFSWGGSILVNGEDFFFNVDTGFNIWSFGNMSQELQDRRETAQNLARAPAAPPIPRWLVDNPPMWVEFIPDDEIITFGPLGSWDDEEVLQSTDWYRYSRDGELLDQTKPGQQWWFEMFFPDFRQVWVDLGDIPEVQFQDMQGIITFCKYDPYEELAVYDYKGNPNPDQFQWDNQPMLFTVIEGRDIPAMYARQQAVVSPSGPPPEDSGAG